MTLTTGTGWDCLLCDARGDTRDLAEAAEKALDHYTKCHPGKGIT